MLAGVRLDGLGSASTPHLDVLVSIAQDLTTAPSSADRYQRLLDLAEECGGITIDEPDQDDER